MDWNSRHKPFEENQCINKSRLCIYIHELLFFYLDKHNFNVELVNGRWNMGEMNTLKYQIIKLSKIGQINVFPVKFGFFVLFSLRGLVSSAGLWLQGIVDG